jgi:transposase
MQCMERASLEQLLGEGLSLAEIGRRAGLHESTVGYWVRKHGLRAVNQESAAGRGGLTCEELGDLVEAGLSIAQIAQRLNRSKATVRYWLEKYELTTGGATRGASREGAREARLSGASEATLTCPHHGITLHVREPRGYFRCRLCRQRAVIRRRRKVKQLLVDEAGGRCRLCGYDRCFAALEFHHLDPSAKEFTVSRCGAHSISRLRAEVRKCILLCSNCHAEVEHGACSISQVAQMDDPG